jgi:pyruvate ferredoxin oxidoreductase gamma subunit
MLPDALIIQDPTLLHQVDVLSGLKRPEGYILINTNKTFAELGLDEYVKNMRADRLISLPATEISLKHVGRAVPNVPLLGGFAAASGLISLASVVSAIKDKFSGKVADGNIAAATDAYNLVKAKEASHA